MNSIKKANILKLTLVLLCMIMSTSLFAQRSMTGKWQSESFNADTESLKIELQFYDSNNVEMAFITDNQIPDVGRCVSRISIKGTYMFIGPLFYTEFDNSTLDVNINKLELAGDLAKTISEDMIPTLKEYFQHHMEQTATALFKDYDGGTMVYVEHDDSNNECSFIISDDEDAIELEFKRIR